jgi:serine protease Do
MICKRLLLSVILSGLVVSGCGVRVPRVLIPQVTTSPPIKIDSFNELPALAFEKGIVALTRGTEIGSGGLVLNRFGDRVDIKKGDNSTLCTFRSHKIHWGTGQVQFSGQEGEFNETFYSAMKSAGYNVVGDPQVLFGKDDERNKAEYKVAARVTNIKSNVCEIADHWIGTPLGTFAGEVYLEVEWSIYSALKRETVALISTAGYIKHEDAVGGGWLLIFLGAFENAVKELAYNQKFYKLISDDQTSEKAIPHNDDIIIVSAEPYKESGVDSNIDRIINSTVTVRSGNGHGSGIIIDASGLIVTNAHVVGNADKIAIVFSSGMEIMGKVLRVNKHRDVALIKVDAGGLRPLPIRSSGLGQAEEVYAIGTPLDESLKSTITKGIVSGIRTEEKTGLKLIQSDVDIQGGNSGGSLLDNKGNVVGISVSGIGLGKLSAGLNFFIPIMDGLKWLNVKIR